MFLNISFFSGLMVIYIGKYNNIISAKHYKINPSLSSYLYFLELRAKCKYFVNNAMNYTCAIFKIYLPILDIFGALYMKVVKII